MKSKKSKSHYIIRLREEKKVLKGIERGGSYNPKEAKKVKDRMSYLKSKLKEMGITV